MDAREVALLSLSRWESGTTKIDSILERELRDADLDPRDVALAQNLTYGVLRWKGRLDWVLDQYVKGGLRSLPVWIRNSLRLGLYQIDYLDRIPPRAAVHESVDLAKRYGHKGTAGLVNAVLRNILTGLRPDFPDVDTDPVAHVAAKYSHPSVLVKRWIERYGLDSTIVLCEYNNEVPRLVVRTNSLRCGTDVLASALRADGRDIRSGRYFDDCLEIGGGGDVRSLDAFRRGFMQVQDESTLVPVRLLDPGPSEEIVDLCAAPGGKTTYMAGLMRGTGRIRAFEISRKRAQMLSSNLRRLGIENCEVFCGEAAPDFAGQADGVLVDAPCTGTGTLGRRVDSKWKFDVGARDRDADEIRELKRIHPRQIFARQKSRQLRLLLQAAEFVRMGGRIVYSTCSLEPEENEDVVERFLEKRSDFVLDDSAQFVPAMFEDGGYVRTLPHKHGIDGGFAVRFVKTPGQVRREKARAEERLPDSINQPQEARPVGSRG